jgi:hypothetical protein
MMHTDLYAPNIKITYRERNDPQETPCTLPKINKKNTA